MDKNRFVSRLVWFFWVTGLTLLFSMGPIQWVLANGSICNGYICIAEQHPSKVNPVYRLIPYYIFRAVGRVGSGELAPSPPGYRIIHCLNSPTNGWHWLRHILWGKNWFGFVLISWEMKILFDHCLGSKKGHLLVLAYELLSATLVISVYPVRQGQRYIGSQMGHAHCCIF